MSNPGLKESLIKEFFDIGGNHKINEVEIVRKKMWEYIRTHGRDSQIEDVLTLIKMYKNEHSNNGFEVSRIIVEPLLARFVPVKEEEGFFGIRVLACVVDFAKTYKHTLEIAKQVLNALTRHKHEKEYVFVKISIHISTLNRLLRCKYIDSDLLKCPKALAQLEIDFNYHSNEISNIYTSSGKDNKYWIPYAASRIREGLFKGNYDQVDESLKLVKEINGKDVWRLFQDEVNDYNVYTGNDISQFQFNALVGKNIRKLRNARKMSMEDLADELNLSSAFIGQIERGERGVSSYKLYKIGNVLGVSCDFFFRGEVPIHAPTEEEIARQEHADLVSKLSIEDLDVLNTMVKRFVHPY